MVEHLRRRVGLGLLTAYGVGVMVGAGIYVLVGAVAANAGVWAPLAFLIAGLVALPSALSYAELAARLPVAAGEAEFVENGFQSRALAVSVGLFIVLAGIVSAAAVLRGGAGYLTVLVDLPRFGVMIAIGVALTVIAIVGVLESLAFAAVFTVIEVVGLMLVTWAGFTAEPQTEWVTWPKPEWAGIGAAVALCLFAFIGFEDLENMAEEVRNPTRIMPQAILLSLFITAVLYGLVSAAAVRAVPRDVLGTSEQPLALVWHYGRGGSVEFLSTIAVAAAINGVLAQIVMASRVLFGLGRKTQALAFFNRVHPRFGTPVLATVFVGIAVILCALTLPVGDLVRVTSALLLVVFFMVNVALILIKMREPDAPFRVPVWVPWAGLLFAAAALVTVFGEGL